MLARRPSFYRTAMTFWAFREERREAGLGLKLVAVLVKQLSASVEIVGLPHGTEQPDLSTKASRSPNDQPSSF